MQAGIGIFVFLFICICIGVGIAAANKDKQSSSSSIGGKHPVSLPKRLVISRTGHDTFCLKCGRLVRAGNRCQHSY